MPRPSCTYHGPIAGPRSAASAAGSAAASSRTVCRPRSASLWAVLAPMPHSARVGRSRHHLVPVGGGQAERAGSRRVAAPVFRPVDGRGAARLAELRGDLRAEQVVADAHRAREARPVEDGALHGARPAPPGRRSARRGRPRPSPSPRPPRPGTRAASPSPPRTPLRSGRCRPAGTPRRGSASPRSATACRPDAVLARRVRGRGDHRRAGSGHLRPRRRRAGRQLGVAQDLHGGEELVQVDVQHPVRDGHRRHRTGVGEISRTTEDAMRRDPTPVGWNGNGSSRPCRSGPDLLVGRLAQRREHRAGHGEPVLLRPADQHVVELALRPESRAICRVEAGGSPAGPWRRRSRRPARTRRRR